MSRAYTDRDKDAITDLYLRTNDPYYTDTRRNKTDELEYPYFTSNMWKRVYREEVMENSLNTEGTAEIYRKGMAENKANTY